MKDIGEAISVLQELLATAKKERNENREKLREELDSLNRVLNKENQELMQQIEAKRDEALLDGKLTVMCSLDVKTVTKGKILEVEARIRVFQKKFINWEAALMKTFQEEIEAGIFGRGRLYIHVNNRDDLERGKRLERYIVLDGSPYNDADGFYMNSSHNTEVFFSGKLNKPIYVVKLPLGGISQKDANDFAKRCIKGQSSSPLTVWASVKNAIDANGDVLNLLKKEFEKLEK